MKPASAIISFAFQCATLVAFLYPAAYAAEEPAVEFLLKGLSVGDFAREERVVALNGGSAWADRSPKLANGEVFKNSGLTEIEWPKYGSFITFIMAGAVPHIYNMSSSGFTILYYNAFLDLSIITRYAGNFENPGKARLDDAYITPGEILRDEAIVDAHPAWQGKGYFLKSMPMVTRDTIVKSTQFGTDISDYFGYFRKKTTAILPASAEIIKGRLIGFAYASVNPKIPCVAELNKAIANPADAVSKLKSGNLKGKPEFMKAVATLYQVGRFTDGADTISLLSTKLPDFLIALRAHVVENVCVVDTGLVFDPQADLNKEFLPETLQPKADKRSSDNDVDMIVTGIPHVVSTSQVLVNQKKLDIEGVLGVEGDYGKQLAAFIKEQGGTIKCVKSSGKSQYRCATATGVDLSSAVLLNGSGRLADNAPVELKPFEEKARARGIGVWAKP